MSGNEGHKLTDSERESVARTTEKTNQIANVLERIIPSARKDLIATTAHDLADMWGMAQNHCVRIETLLKLQGPEDRPKLAELLSDLLYGDVNVEMPYHLKSMEQVLPRLIEALETGIEKK